MKEKNKIISPTTAVAVIFIMNIALVKNSNATENPFEINSINNSYMVADGHKHTEPNQDDHKQKECNPDKGQNCNPPIEVKDSQDDDKQKECNPDKGQNCNPPAW